MKAQTLFLITRIQATGGIVAVIDCTKRFNSSKARTQGVVVEDLLISQPETFEDVKDILGTLSRSGQIDLIVIKPNRPISRNMSWKDFSDLNEEMKKTKTMVFIEDFQSKPAYSNVL